jgi:hypothetical protein
MGPGSLAGIAWRGRSCQAVRRQTRSVQRVNRYDRVSGASQYADSFGGDRIEIAAGGGLRLENAASVARATGAKHFHGSLRRRAEPVGSARERAGDLLSMGTQYVVDADDVRTLIQRLENALRSEREVRASIPSPMTRGRDASRNLLVKAGRLEPGGVNYIQNLVQDQIWSATEGDYAGCQQSNYK